MILGSSQFYSEDTLVDMGENAQKGSKGDGQDAMFWKQYTYAYTGPKPITDSDVPEKIVISLL